MHNENEEHQVERRVRGAKKKAARELEVRVTFEPNRLAEEYLERAYTCVAPVARRAVGALPRELHASTPGVESDGRCVRGAR